MPARYDPPLTPKSRARKGVEPSTVTEAAFRLLVEEGETGFGVRPLATRLGLDPMTVLHHGGSREKLLRAASDRMLAELPAPDAGQPWRERLHSVAAAFRSLAQRYPKGLSAIIRFQATGPADYRLGEAVYGALLEAGLPKQQAAELGLSFYALVLGFALSEVQGMLQVGPEEERQELVALSPKLFPVQHGLIGSFLQVDPDRMFNAAVDAFLDGIGEAVRRTH
jgi:AcrR family transcriptional regulator